MTEISNATRNTDQDLLLELAAFLDLEPEEDDIAAAAFDRLGFAYPSQRRYHQDLVRRLVLELERRREAGTVVREHQEDGPGLLYVEPVAAGGDKDTRLVAARRLMQEVAGGISGSFVKPWP